MDYCTVSPWIFIFMLLSIWNIGVRGQSNNNFVVTDFGAVADEKTDNKQSFANAWKKACETAGGTVSVPEGTFFVSVGDFEGPCNGQTQFHVDGTLTASEDEQDDQDFWLTFTKLDGFILSGNGILNGNGASTWSHCKASESCNNRPTSLKIMSVTNGVIQGINLVNSKMFHVKIDGSQNFMVKNVNVSAPEDSPNTDGIHIGHSNGVQIFDSRIGTGDDCISIGDGCKDVNISGVLCGPGHGISIGSLGKYEGEQDVSGITVRNCSLKRTTNGVRIKTMGQSKSSIVVSNVTFTGISMDSVDNPIIIDQYYCPSGSSGSCGQDGAGSSVEIRGVKYVDIKGSSSEGKGVSIECSKSKPCKDIEFVGLDLTSNGQPTTAICSNSDSNFQGSDQVPSHCSSN